MKIAYVYIMSNKNRTTNYIGVTSNLQRRILEHKCGMGSQFTSKYQLHDLVYFDEILGIGNAIIREKQLKKWYKEWKWKLIKEINPNLVDLANDWYSDDEIDEYRKLMKERRSRIESGMTVELRDNS